MKQSKKLLSIFLALIMMLGTVSVIANAGYQKAQMAYDAVDNPAPTADQVANLVLDVLDELLAEMNFNENYVVVKINLTSVDKAIETLGSFNGIKGIAGGDIAALDLDAVRKSNQTRAQRGDMNIIYDVLEFLYDNADVLSKAAYGIGTKNGIDLGWLIDLIGLDLGEIGTILEDIPGYLTKMVYDMLIHGSYNANYVDNDKSYPSVEDLEAAGQALPAEADSLDEIINTAINTFLTKPQKYTYVPTGELDEDDNPISKKVWDENSYILTADKIAGKDLTLVNNSIFSILDSVLQIAYEDFGTVAVNHDVKKLFMEAMDVDFVELDPVADAAEINKIKSDADYVDVEGNDPRVATVKNFFCNAQMWEVDGVWYFRDYVTRPVLDANGNLQYETDDEGNQVVITALQHRYQRAEAYAANDLYDLVNWGYNLSATTFNFNELIPQYGSIIGCLNHILHVILEAAINPTALAKFGLTSIDQIWADGGNDCFNENLMRTAKFVLTKFTFQFFGRNPQYVDLNTLEAKPEFVAKVNSFDESAAGREGLIAYMLLPFLGDALPQLVYDLDMFTPGLQIEQVAALLVREFLSDLTPQINYDDQIFVDPTFATGRQFKTYTSAQWMDLILNMGLDLGAIYLDNICNIGLDMATLETIKGYAVAAGHSAWMGTLEEIVDYAVNYIGTDATSVLAGCEPSTLGSVRCITAYDYTTNTVSVANNYAGNAFTILSTVLNKLLPLGLLCNVSSDSFALDVKMLFDRLIDVIDDVDLEVLLGTFGRNGRTDNLLGVTNVVDRLLKLVNQLVSCILGFNLFPVTSSLNGAVTQANLKTIVANLLKSLYSRRLGLLPNALPIVASFVDDWGSEQAIRTPELSLGEVTYASNGALNVTVTVSNGSRGIWRGYMQNGARAQDEQYAYNIQAITSAQGLTIGSGYAGKVDYGATKTFTISGTVPAAGLGDRIDVQYQVYNEDGQLMENGKSYNKAFFTYFAYDSNEYNHINDSDYEFFVKKALVFGVTPDENGKLQATDEMINIGNVDTAKFYHSKASDGKSYSLEMQSQPGNGFTTNNSKVEEGCDKKTDYWLKAVSFNQANYTAPDAAAGQTLSFTYKFYSWYKKTVFSSNTYCGWHEDANSSFPTSYIKIYDAVAMDELRALVNEETGLNRRPETYKAEGDYYGYLATLGQAIAVAWNPGIDGSFNTDSTTIRLALEEAIAKLDANKMTPAEQAAAGLATVDAAVNALETQLNAVEEGLGGKDYRTFMLYRWSRYQSAKSDANYVINLASEFNAGLQTKKFPYSSMPVYALKDAVSGDQYEGYILALLEDLNEEELAQSTERFKEVTRNYGGYTTLDVAQISNLVTRMSGRLLPREGGVVNTYLTKEINSAKTEIGATNTKGYSERSWNAYAAALANAEAVVNSASQDEIFNAKYALQVARNNLRTEADEADYTELENLMTQATAIFWNPALYENTYAEIGAVLAAWGYTTTNGTDTVIFPNSAKAVNGRSYDKGDQDEVDEAADALKKALAKMEFKGATYNGNDVVDSEVLTGREDSEGNPIKESVRTTVLDAKSLLDTVKASFEGSGATGATDAEVRISLDDNYTLSHDSGNKFVGTGATITIYTTQSGVKIPLSTIKVVVKGDTTGDGVIDVLDCMIVELAVTDNTSLTGVYDLAGNLDGLDGYAITDLQAVANRAFNR
ncbi:MAG: hypothetical protein IKC01_07745 [Clostridia bacterium]|nr:hypothetical protein [Clostridia bacterium]